MEIIRFHRESTDLEIETANFFSRNKLEIGFKKKIMKILSIGVFFCFDYFLVKVKAYN